MDIVMRIIINDLNNECLIFFLNGCTIFYVFNFSFCHLSIPSFLPLSVSFRYAAKPPSTSGLHLHHGRHPSCVQHHRLPHTEIVSLPLTRCLFPDQIFSDKQFSMWTVYCMKSCSSVPNVKLCKLLLLYVLLFSLLVATVTPRPPFP